jgi:hypothetical protein
MFFFIYFLLCFSDALEINLVTEHLDSIKLDEKVFKYESRNGFGYSKDKVIFSILKMNYLISPDLSASQTQQFLRFPTFQCLDNGINNTIPFKYSRKRQCTDGLLSF